MGTWQPVAFGDRIPVRCERGPISFGLNMSGAVMAGPGGQGKRLLLSRIWDGIYAYEGDRLGDSELSAEPSLAYDTKGQLLLFCLADWNRDGLEDMIAGGRSGFLHLVRRKTEVAGKVAFEHAEQIVDRDSGLPFNLPFDNPHHRTTALSGYTDPDFYNYLYPLAYPNRRRPGAIDLIVGDMSGNLWWMADLSADGADRHEYAGVVYEKPADTPAEYGRRLREQYGTRFAQPAGKITDENGEPFLLGVGVEGKKQFPGGNVRPVLYRNPLIGSDDLIVLTGYEELKVYYLQRVNGDEDGSGASVQPAFRNLGEVAMHGILQLHPYAFHDKLIVDHEQGYDDVLLTSGSYIARLRNKRPDRVVPEYELQGLITADNAITNGFHYTTVLEDRDAGGKYLLDVGFRDWKVRGIVQADEGGIVLSEGTVDVEDQHGVFHVDGETDPLVSPACGLHSAALWDYDGSGRQHLVVGTDKGLLYLLIDEGEVGNGGRFRFRSAGPLKDSGGAVIRIHNRLNAIAVDLDGGGREDLLVGGATYQCGFEFDPEPGAGIYYLLHRGLDPASGLPILEPRERMPFDGEPCPVVTNRMVELQAVDLDGDGETEIVIWSVLDNFARIYRIAEQGRVGLVQVGTLADMTLFKRLLDLDGDGKPEIIYGGGEPGVAYIQRIV